MADSDDGAESANSVQAPSEPVSGSQNDSVSISSESSASANSRVALMEHARNFLNSPRIMHEDLDSKRRFLSEKGLSSGEIERLLQELPPQLPAVPPRTYPQPPPSNLPYLLMGLFKALSWVTGGSVVLVLLYYRFLLPRLTRSALARRSLKEHQISLLKRLNTSLASLKSTQKETFSVLPPPPPFREPSEYADVHSLKKLELDKESAITIPPFTLLRCTIEGLTEEGKRLTKEELFALLEEKFPWLRSEDGMEYQTTLWKTLTENTCFSEVEEGGRLVWAYTPLPAPSPTPFETSLDSLKSTVSSASNSSITNGSIVRHSIFQRTLESLVDFTGYITTQTYQLSASSMRMHGIGLGLSGNSTLQSPQQEDIRKEIRALKGLVLNRRTFAPASSRPSSQSSPIQSP